MESNFFATVARMKYIERWALMRNTRPETLSEHTLEVSMIAHALCVIGNVRYGKQLDANHAAMVGMYHDASEIITGDMPTPIKYYNPSIKEAFKSINPGHVGMYVCGPTVYGDAHLGHARPAITFDILYRYLQHIGYKVRYVRNITDVGHLEHDADEGEDKIAKKARLEQLEPMEIAEYFTRRFNAAMQKLNVLSPSIEPHATGHIIEQQQLVQQILDNGYAYISNGSVYFDIEKYNKDYKYGILSGRTLENIKDASRDTLAGVGEKKNQADFALWKKASPEHIMRWPSPWSEGFPGWHLECSAMGTKYLGETFDIHGGGMDLMFPHHECEIAQSCAALGHETVKYWMHNNMITINGQKMGKSLGNFITLDEFFNGNHKLLSKAFSPMTIRFFILQAHYRSTVDFSSEALEASEKGLARLLEAYSRLKKISPAKTSSVDVKGLKEKFKDTFGLTLRVYTTVTCKSPAKDDATLASIRAEGAKGGEITVGSNRKVGSFEKMVADAYGIGVQVANASNTKLASDDDTLAAAAKK